jgi:hypothetical protein
MGVIALLTWQGKPTLSLPRQEHKNDFSRSGSTENVHLFIRIWYDLPLLVQLGRLERLYLSGATIWN